MAKKPTLAQVAVQAGVSVATASQVMRGTGRISESTRNLVLSTAEKLSYVPDARAAAMRSGENKEIGLSIHKISNRFNSEVIAGASDLLESEGYLLSVLDARDDANRQRKQIESFIRSSRGGLLWVPAENTPQSTFDLLQTHGLPSVTFLRRPENVDLDHVGIENSNATARATQHLAELGHKNIAMFTGAHDAVLSERIAGYERTMRELGLGPTIVVECEDSRPGGIAAMNDLRAQHPEVTAVISTGDMVAIGACIALQRRNEAVGKDVSVVGFDDIPDAVLNSPPLTSLSTSPYELGRKLARVMLERIKEPTAPSSVTLVPAPLVVRESTGACPK